MAEDQSRAQTCRPGPYDQRVIAFGHLNTDFQNLDAVAYFQTS